MDGTWQKRDFSSLLGIVYVIEFNTGKVLDYKVFSKFCNECNIWNKHDKDTEAYKSWKLGHQNHCNINFEGSTGAMEPAGIFELFKHSLNYKIHYKNFISDGDSKTFAII